MNEPNPLKNIRSVMEVPIMDDKKWAKIPSIEADAFFIDLEDSAPLPQKADARSRAVELLKDPKHLEGRLAIPRVNSLETKWGYDDLVAMAEAKADIITYPKVGSAGEIELVRQILSNHGAAPNLCVVVESARGINNIQEIAQAPDIVGMFFGPSDLSLDSGFDLYDDSGMTSAILEQARGAITFAAAANGIETFDALFVKDMRNNDQVLTAARNSRKSGFSGILTFYPPHIALINEAFSVSEAQMERAERVVGAYEEAMHEGKTAVMMDGEALIIQDYKRALAVLGQPF